MLVLSRKKQETLVIDDRIEFEILNADSGSVRIGIRSPNSVEVRRGELSHSTSVESIECPLGSEDQSGQSSFTEGTGCSNSPRDLSQLPNPFVAMDD